MSVPTLFQRIVLSAVVALSAAVPAPGQALQPETEEVKRLQGEIADLREANESYVKKLEALTRQLAKLQEEMRSSSERSALKAQEFVTREDLKTALERLTAALDEKRENDRRLILEQFEMLQSALVSNRKGASEAAKTQNAGHRSTDEIEGTFLPYEVGSDETVGGIVLRYNAKLKGEGRPTISLSDVRRANPTINLDRVKTGQTIQLPVPDKPEK